MISKSAFEIATHAIIEKIKQAKLPPQLKKSINHAHLENVK